MFVDLIEQRHKVRAVRRARRRRAGRSSSDVVLESGSGAAPQQKRRGGLGRPDRQGRRTPPPADLSAPVRGGSIRSEGMPPIVGMRGTEQLAPEQKKIEMADKIKMLVPDETPFTTFLQSSRRPVPAGPSTSASKTTCCRASTARRRRGGTSPCTVDVATGSKFQPNDVVIVTRTGEQLVVSDGRRATSSTVARGRHAGRDQRRRRAADRRLGAARGRPLADPGVAPTRRRSRTTRRSSVAPGS